MYVEVIVCYIIVVFFETQCIVLITDYRTIYYPQRVVGVIANKWRTVYSNRRGVSHFW